MCKHGAKGKVKGRDNVLADDATGDVIVHVKGKCVGFSSRWSSHLRPDVDRQFLAAYLDRSTKVNNKGYCKWWSLAISTQHTSQTYR